MRLKKINASIALISVFLLVFHIVYCTYTYLSSIYNAAVIKTTAYIFMGFALIHGVLAMCSLKMGSDGSALRHYRKQNRMTVVQRVCAFLIVPMLILHIFTYPVIRSAAQSGNEFLFVLMLIFQPLFYAVVLGHVAPSVSRALISLGVLTTPSGKKAVDTVSYILSAVLFVTASFVVIRMDIIMFAGDL